MVDIFVIVEEFESKQTNMKLFYQQKIILFV